MAHIIVPSRRIWTRQPQQAVGLRSEYSDGSVLLAANGRLDVVDAGPVALPSNLSLATKSGFSCVTNASTSANAVAISRGLSGNSWAAVFVGSLITGLSGYDTFFQTSNGLWLKFGNSYAGDNKFGVVIPGTANYTSNISVRSGAPFVAIFSGTNSGAYDLVVRWLDDQQIQVATGIAIGTASSTTGASYLLSESTAPYGPGAGSFIAMAGVFRRRMPLVEALSIAQNPWQIFRPQVRRSFFDMGAGGAISGSLSASESPDTVSSSVALLVSASHSANETDDTASSASSITIAASLAVAEVAETLAATGAVISGVSASATITELPDGLSSATGVSLQASLSIAESSDTGASVVSVLTQASAGIAESSDTVYGASAVAVQSSAPLMESADTLVATASAVSGISASAAISESADTASAQAVVNILALMASADDNDTTAATSQVALVATSSVVEAQDTLSATGLIDFTGIAAAAAITESGDYCAAFGAIQISSLANLIDVAETLAASGVININATVSVNDAAETLTAAVSVGAALSLAQADIDAIAAAVLAALQATTIPVDAVTGAWPTAIENADAVWSKQLP